MKILFVCLANLSRSPMAKAIAETIFEGTIEADSAGIAPSPGPVYPEAAMVLREFYGVELTGHRPKYVLEYPVASYDYIIALDSAVFIRLSEMKEIPKDRLFGWEVPDPSGLGIEAYEHVAVVIEQELEKFLDRNELG